MGSVGDTLTRFASTAVLPSSIRDMKPFVRRVQPRTTSHPHSSTMPMFEPIPKVELKINRKCPTTKTSGTSENDALMQYLLRPISTLSCFVSDAQNMAEAPDFGTSLLRSQSVLPSNWPLCRLGRHFHAWHAPMPDCPPRWARGRCMGTRFWQKVLCYVSVTILPSRRVNKLSR